MLPRFAITDTVQKWIDAAPLPRRAPPGHTFPTGDVLAQIESALDRTKGKYEPLCKKLRAWLADPARFTDKYDDDVQLGALNIVGRFNGSPFFTDEWVEAFGVERALRQLLRAPIAELQGNWGSQLVGDPHADPGGNKYGQQDAIYKMQPFVAKWSNDQLAALKKALGPDIEKLHTLAQLRFAVLVRDQAAIDAFARRAAADAAWATAIQSEMATSIVPILVQHSHDADAVEKLITEHAAAWRFGSGSTIARAFATLGPERAKRALLAIIPELEKPGRPGLSASGGDFKTVMQVVQCIDDDEIALVIARHGHVKNLTPIVIDYFTRHPHHQGALEAAAKEKGKLGTAATMILDSVRRHAPTVEADSSSAADDADVPRVLLSPPFETAKKKAPPAREVPIPSEPATHLRPGEYATWLQSWHMGDVRDIASLRELVASGNPAMREQYLEGLMSIIGPESVPLVIELAARAPAHNVELLTHVISPRAMVGVASLLAKAKLAPRARQWLIDHADVAARGLVPATTSADPKVREAAIAGIAALTAAGKTAEVEAVARELGVAATQLATDDGLPKPGKLPPFADGAALPAPVLAKDGKPLPRHAVENLLAILSVLPKDRTHPVVAEIKAACTQASLDAFVWTLVSDYVLAGGNARHDWALFAAGHLGSDEVARKIDLAARKWVQKSVELMQKSLDVLALIGTDVALSLLYERGLVAKFEDTQERARQILEQVAAHRAISYDQLEDVLVPELGLDAGPITLDYGARRFEVKLDERLVPYVLEGDARKDKPPKVVKGDDKEKAKQAALRFETLAEDLSHVARTQVLRLERAMREAREWTLEEWLNEIVRHPLLRHVAPRLVWSIDGGLVRVAEDGTLADASDAPVKPGKTARVRVAHRLDVPRDEWDRMARVFADYEILQPFNQLARETFAAPAQPKYDEMAGKKAPFAAVDELLTGRGWIRTPPEDGTVKMLEFPLDRYGVVSGNATLRITPGLTIGRVKARPEQTIGSLELHGASWTDLGARIVSEIVRDVSVLAS